MNKKLIISALIASVVVITAVGGGYIYYVKNQKSVSPLADVQPTQAPVEATDTWTDPAQFSFRYPKSLTLNPHREDQENYAHVELSSATHSGSLIVWVKDTNADTIDNWVTQEKVKGAFDTTLDNVPARKVVIGTQTNKLIISAINGGYLYQIEFLLPDGVNGDDRDYWNKVLNGVTSSFKFTPSKDSDTSNLRTSQTDQGSSDTGGGDEEVIE